MLASLLPAHFHQNPPSPSSLISSILSLCRGYQISQENDLHLGTVFYDLLNSGPKPGPVMSNIASCLKCCTVFFRFTERVKQKNTYVLTNSNIRTFLVTNSFSRSGYPVVQARNIKMLNLNMFHHTNFGKLLVC